MKNHKLVFKEVNKIPKIHKDLPRKSGILLSKLRTNRWTDCEFYQHMIGNTQDPNCKKCGVEDNSTHILTSCMRHDKERHELIKGLEYKITKPTDILCTNNKKELRLLEKFILNVNSERNNKNGTTNHIAKNQI